MATEASRMETIVGVFADRGPAEDAVRDLEEAGFSGEEIGFLTPGETDPRDDFGKKVLTTTAGAAAAGGVAGGILAALATGLIPGIGPVIGGGALAVLVATYTGGATGGVAGMLFSASAAEDPRTNYSEFLRQGRTLVTITAADRAPEAREILARFGAQFPAEAAAVNPPQPGAEI